MIVDTVSLRFDLKESTSVSYQPERTKMLGVDDEPTRSLSVPSNVETPEQEAARLAEDARIRQQERAARARALGAVPPAEDDDEVPDPPSRADNDRFAGSFGLFLLRLVLTAYLSVRGVQVLFNVQGTATWLSSERVPHADIFAWVLGIVLLICSLMLLLGLGTRTASVVIALLTIALLVFVRWGYAALFTQGQAGFLGETDVLIAGIALALVFLGSGGWAIDGVMRHNRLIDK